MLRTKTQRIATGAVLFAIVLLAADFIVSRVWPESNAPAVQSGTIGNGRLAVGTMLDRPVPNVSLVDERGHATPLSSFRGRYLVFAPSMTLCHEVCPMTTAALERVQSAVAKIGLGSQVTVAEVSIDPWRDTPARLRAYQKLTGLHFRLLTGSRAQLTRMWKFFGVYFHRVPQGKPPDTDWLTHKPETFDVEHTDGLFIVDPQGHWRVGAVGMPSVGGKLAPALKRLLNENGQKNLHHPQAPWTPKAALADLVTLKQQDDSKNAAATGQSPARAPSPAEIKRALAGSPASPRAEPGRDQARAGGLSGAAREPPQPGGLAARRRDERVQGAARRSARPPGRGERVGLLVSALPQRVPAPRSGIGALRQARRVPRRERDR